MLTVAEFVWAVKPDSPIKSIKDFKGKKIGYTNPRSTSQALARMLLQAGGLHRDDAELVKTGGFGEGIAALDSGQIDVAAITEPLWSKVKAQVPRRRRRERSAAAARQRRRRDDGEMAEKKGDFLRAVIRARRKAVEFMNANPTRPARSSPRNTSIELEVAKSAVRNLMTSKTQGIPYWGDGQIHMEGLKRMIEAQRSVGAITGEVDYSKIIDTRFLPDDLKALK